MTKDLKKEDLATCIESFASIVVQENSVDKMRNFSKAGEIGKKHLRSLAWRLFLGVLDEYETIQDWIKTLFDLRAEYKEKRKKLCSKKKKLAGDPLTGIDPLKTKDENWKSYFVDNEVKELIKLDISRTYQEITQFLDEKNKTMLENILFIWSKENQDVNYRQGMNDLLAVFYLACYSEYFPNKKKNTLEELMNYAEEQNFKTYSAELFAFFNDENEIEADLFYLFSNLMKKGMKDLYNTDIKGEPINYKKAELIRNQWSNDTENDPQTIINVRCNSIIKDKLRAIDEDLYNHLNDIQLCMVFLQRYLKCIFNREFEFMEAFLLWDAVFANEEDKSKTGLPFIDYIALAMILRIRKELLEGDQNDCLSLIFHYQPPEDIHDLVIIAEKIKITLSQYKKGMVIDLDALISKKIPLFNFHPIANVPNMTTTLQNTIVSKETSNPIVANVYGEEEKPKKKGFFEKVKNFGQKVSETFKEKKTNEINNILITNQKEAINIFEEILRKYKGKMSNQDSSDFQCAINYMKLNSK